MEKYTIVSRIHTQNRTDNGQLIQMYVVEIRCDSAAYLPAPAPWWDVGSACFFVDTQEVRFLNSQGVWE